MVRVPGDRYDLILLDADGTLFDFDAAAEAAFRGACAGFGLGTGAASTDDLFSRYRVINHGIWAELERGEIDKETLKSERFRRLFTEFSIDTDPSAFSSRFLDLLSQGNQLIPGAEDFVRSLSLAGKRLALVTNGISTVQRGRFARSPFGALIPDLFISEELGAEKPARTFFSEAFKRLGRPEAEKKGVAVVGDSWSADVAGAVAFDLDAFWFNPSGKPRPDGAGEFSRVREVRTYAEALEALL